MLQTTPDAWPHLYIYKGLRGSGAFGPHPSEFHPKTVILNAKMLQIHKQTQFMTNSQILSSRLGVLAGEVARSRLAAAQLSRGADCGVLIREGKSPVGILGRILREKAVFQKSNVWDGLGAESSPEPKTNVWIGVAKTWIGLGSQKSNKNEKIQNPKKLKSNNTQSKKS